MIVRSVVTKLAGRSCGAAGGGPEGRRGHVAGCVVAVRVGGHGQIVTGVTLAVVSYSARDIGALWSCSR